MLIVDPPVVEARWPQSRAIERAVAAASVRRLLATLELYTYILNGESRVGVFNHGPYPLGEERSWSRSTSASAAARSSGERRSMPGSTP